jgi:iron complex transport system ATP-binding protein
MAAALLATLLLYLLTRGGASNLTLILAGIALSSLAGALTSLALNLAPNPASLQDIVLWLLGSIADRSLADVRLVLPFVLLGLALLLMAAPSLTLLTLGEGEASSLGVPSRTAAGAGDHRLRPVRRRLRIGDRYHRLRRAGGAASAARLVGTSPRRAAAAERRRRGPAGAGRGPRDPPARYAAGADARRGHGAGGRAVLPALVLKSRGEPAVSLLSVSGLSVRSADERWWMAPIYDVEQRRADRPDRAERRRQVDRGQGVLQILPHRGEVRFRRAVAASSSARERARNLAYLSQEDRVQWPITVRGAGGARALSAPHPPGAAVRGLAVRRETLTDERSSSALRPRTSGALRARRADQLSGGERARARLARVLAVEAPLLLADEPVAALDPRHQLEVMALLRDHCDAGGGGIVVLHDLTLASRFCDRLVLLHRGRRVAAGAIQAVLSAERLHSVYGVEAVTGRHAGQHYVVPWACTTSGGEPS